MRRIRLLATMILFLGVTIPVMAQVRVEVAPPPPPAVRVTVPLPPPIVFAAPPEVVVLPETEVYTVPSVQEDIFFVNGYWWRPWGGRWYRSLRYDGGWGFYSGVPVWYGGVYHGWRENYRLGLWGGHPWHHHPISHHDLHANWRTWHNTGHWNKPEHREFTHHHDGRVYTAAKQDRSQLNKGAAHANVNKGATGTGQGQVNKNTTQANVNKNTTATGQSHVNRNATQGNLNRGVTTTGSTGHGATGQGHVGTGGHGATGGNVHSSGQATKGQHN